SDHQHTVRDWVRSSGGSTTLADHAQYDAFGNRLDAPTVDSLFGYTGRYHDDDTGLQWNGSDQGGGRWYDSATGRWLSEDSIGFRGDASNLYRCVENGATIFVDPSGTEWYNPFTWCRPVWDLVFGNTPKVPPVIPPPVAPTAPIAAKEAMMYKNLLGKLGSKRLACQALKKISELPVATEGDKKVKEAALWALAAYCTGVVKTSPRGGRTEICA
ncbi:MAG: RHS repeat-associated core domain-containing protein, partial [Pirellulales bacterium]|nr:RHS repeat-associated core domain-containing protein [Pirellulales bacterium]